jgi:hypothetical protein
MHISHLAAALSIAAAQGSPTTQEVLAAQHGCYDVAVTGHIVDMHDFQSLEDLLPRTDGRLWWGGIAYELFHTKKQVAGAGPRLFWFKRISSASYLRTALLLLLVKNHPSGVPIAVYTTGIKVDSPRQIAKALGHSELERCQ